MFNWNVPFQCLSNEEYSKNHCRARVGVGEESNWIQTCINNMLSYGTPGVPIDYNYSYCVGNVYKRKELLCTNNVSRRPKSVDTHQWHTRRPYANHSNILVVIGQCSQYLPSVHGNSGHSERTPGVPYDQTKLHRAWKQQPAIFVYKLSSDKNQAQFFKLTCMMCYQGTLDSLLLKRAVIERKRKKSTKTRYKFVRSQCVIKRCEMPQ